MGDIRKVLISDSVDPKCKSVLEAKGIEVTLNTKLSPAELVAEIPNYDGLIVRSATKVTAEVIKAGKNLKIIGRAGTGVDNIDIKAATECGVIVMNTPGGNTLSAAEHTCTLMVCLARQVPQAAASMREGRWDRKKYMGIELMGKTLGIIGLGRIGREVATRMQSFGVRTVGYDPIVPAEAAKEFDVEFFELNDLWPECDFITVHTPLIPQTRGLLGDETFAKCKKGVRVINCARGGIIDEAALLRALQSGQCAGAALDVFEQEPPQNTELVQHPNVIPVCHLGASTVEAQSRVAVEIAEQFVDFNEGKSLFGAINANAMVKALSPSAKSLVKLGERLGRLVEVLYGLEACKELSIVAQGPDYSEAPSFLPAAILSGVLARDASGVTLNLVNAPDFAKKKGITAKATYSATPDARHSNSITVSVGGHVFGGTVIGNFSPVFTELDGKQLHSPINATGNIVIGQGPAGSAPKFMVTMAEHGISTYACSGSDGIGMLDVSAVVPEEVFNKIRSLPDVKSADML
ncbi:D-3-phosphoglycerate dehydrogenase [Trichoplax sp. H2]|uniref:D-3-phosphoglycerate dehydrogenase n=1 Tax=Trichoplax adhaerens TaxID=10228 RepID=B3RTC6_TRIAD|nr:hypothetical protein TRIADDRAFT_37449 [Trichoplax adhaerens]EDV26671.1 hypothetical protein TRIADDRAFT_37449 [Trichoplax adhaerens]RDD40965.1 D-3-phosphoglycerate dehydrogenase [Trichoplax sp. H2]|eukprot:XP_002110667.1 hypothetical protein TRIADDRAFT_37449 [Trichoplax adhaerens]